ncbi:hypothetical protein HK097_009841 [Rhizophlyctis rosea]|uniref:PBZ-type domain-containing protein n=1 Tax=Rhizophlyctis rosea TaxID=64517 RepID=A0AAD5SPI1_9FUNG|nr:hypothetical protein HK097_009841 [Rhizophlyctis rosea]
MSSGTFTSIPFWPEEDANFHEVEKSPLSKAFPALHAKLPPNAPDYYCKRCNPLFLQLENAFPDYAFPDFTHPLYNTSPDRKTTPFNVITVAHRTPDNIPTTAEFTYEEGDPWFNNVKAKEAAFQAYITTGNLTCPPGDNLSQQRFQRWGNVLATLHSHGIIPIRIIETPFQHIQFFSNGEESLSAWDMSTQRFSPETDFSNIGYPFTVPHMRDAIKLDPAYVNALNLSPPWNPSTRGTPIPASSIPRFLILPQRYIDFDLEDGAGNIYKMRMQYNAGRPANSGVYASVRCRETAELVGVTETFNDLETLVSCLSARVLEGWVPRKDFLDAKWLKSIDPDVLEKAQHWEAGQGNDSEDEDGDEDEDDEKSESDGGEDEEDEGDTRAVCKYGTNCYRKNPVHFAEYAHPWLDKPKETSPKLDKPTTPKPKPNPLSRIPATPFQRDFLLNQKTADRLDVFLEFAFAHAHQVEVLLGLVMEIYLTSWRNISYKCAVQFRGRELRIAFGGNLGRQVGSLPNLPLEIWDIVARYDPARFGCVDHVY